MGNGEKWPRGSEWRKWDLHVHTPDSVLNNGFGSDWDAYVQNLFKTLIVKDIATVGITDYFTIDGYKKIKENYLANDAKLKTLFSDEEIKKIKKILVLPNIEFRSDVFVGSKSINFHIIFSESVPVKDIEDKFLHDIKFIYQGDPWSKDKIRPLKVVNLVELGKRLKVDHDEFQSQTDLYIGMMTAVVPHKEVTNILANTESVFGGKYVFVVEADADMSAIKWNSRDHLARKVLVQKSNLLFSSNSKTRSWGLGKPPYNGGEDKFLNEFITLKPCIHGSDAHDFIFIGHPCIKRGDETHDCSSHPQECKLRFCWIKADPTFEGLKQVLYEPEDRVVIQEEDPTLLKSTQTISNFKIKGTILEPELKFKETNLIFNEGLVAVTGGKGSGKTALVDIVDNFYENRVTCNDKNSFVKRVSENECPKDLKTTIKLQSGQEHTKEIKDSSFIEEASIVYIAQGQLENHVEDPARLEAHINSLIFNSYEIKDSELLFDYENINDEVLSINESINSTNKTIFNLENETKQETEESLKREGKRLNTDLIDAEKKIETIAKGQSQEKIKEAEEKQKQLAELREKKTQLTNLGIAIKEALKFADENIVSFNTQVVKINDLAAELKLPSRFKTIEYLDTEKMRVFIVTVRSELKKTIGAIEKFQKDLDEKEKGVKEHANLLDKKKELEKTIQLIKGKLKVIEEKKKLLVGEITKRNTRYAALLNKRIEQRNKYLSIIELFAENKKDILNDLEFTAELIFDHDRFVETMCELVDLRKIKIKGTNEDDSDIAFFTSAMKVLVAEPMADKVKKLASSNVGELLEKIVSNQKKAETISRLSIYNSVFMDYITVMPSVKYKRVKLSKLSLGQKATVLIKIYLAQGENPIIIDSHDDHLDNEYIMDELVKALRQAKQHRQIIIVSNNGNVVVNSDAEQVIIACRDDRGEISYISGSLENPALRPKLLGVLEGGEVAFNKRQQKYRLHK